MTSCDPPPSPPPWQYWEPAPAIPLNNAAALLGEREAREEGAVLLRLTRTVRVCVCVYYIVR